MFLARVSPRNAFSVVLLMVSSSALRADEWVILGPRAMGMGGAGVAVTRGAHSTYWNPAALSPPRRPVVDTFWDVEVPLTVSGTATNDLLRNLDEVSDLIDDLNFNDLEDALDDPLRQLTDRQLQDTLKLLADGLPALGEQGTGLISYGALGVLGRVGRFGISGLALAYAGGLSRVNPNGLALGDEGLGGILGAGNDRSGALSGPGQGLADSLTADGLAAQNQAEEFIFQAEQAGLNTADPIVQGSLRHILSETQANQGGSIDNFFTRNGSGVDLRGMILQEYALAYGHPFFDLFSVGLSAKLLHGSTYFQPFTLNGLDDFGDLADDAFSSRNRKDSFNFGIDVGLLVQPLSWLALGLTGRNLNRPSFEFRGPGDYVVEPQLRAGVGLTPLPGLTLAADADCFVNHSEVLLGYDSQVIGGGAEYALFDILFVRAGLSKNVRESDEDFVIHAGLGFALGFFQFDLAAGVTPDTTDIADSGTEVPERAGVSLQIGFNVPLD